MTGRRTFYSFVFLQLVASMACNLASAMSAPPSEPTSVSAPPEATAPPADIATSTAQVVHVVRPGNPPGAVKLVYDVVSDDTAPERRAPYGDSYEINRLERPFKQDMTYLPYLDIWTYTVDSDSDWWYVSIKIVGQYPEGETAIQFGVELDRDHDGFGEFIIVGRPPFSTDWETGPVRVFEDKNHDTGGLSAEHSDAPLTTDGYETLIFSGGSGDTNPDVAWVRTVVSERPTIQFAFQKSWAGIQFMLGVIADAGLQDPGKLDYVDRFSIAQAGSPVRANSNYPLKELYAVDNACREAFGFRATGYEPQICPREEQALPKPTKEPSTCQDPGNCPYGWSGEPYCYCTPY